MIDQKWYIAGKHLLVFISVYCGVYWAISIIHSHSKIAIHHTQDQGII